MIAAFPITFPLLANNEVHPANGFLVPVIRGIATELSAAGDDGMWVTEGRGIAERVKREEFVDLHVFDESGREILGAKTVPGLGEFMLQSHAFPHLIGQRVNGRDLIGLERFEAGGMAYDIALTRQVETYRIMLTLLTEREPQRATLTAVGLGALVSLGLALHLSTPLRRLAETARRVRGENLSVRVDERVTRRRDEIGEVAREFDRALERVEVAEENRKTLLRDVSHELRAPLTRLQLAAAIAAQASRRDNEEESPELRQVQQEGERLDQLISQLLALSRLEYQSGHERKRIQLDEVVNAVVEDAQPLAEDRGSQVVLQQCPPVSVLGEAFALSSAVDNLVRNALLHTPSGTTVRVNVERSGRSAIRITVADDGPGIDEDIAERAFDPFVRQSNHEYSGSGIGLALVKRAVEAHGGTVIASTGSEGSGLVMCITLPVA